MRSNSGPVMMGSQNSAGVSAAIHPSTSHHSNNNTNNTFSMYQGRPTMTAGRPTTTTTVGSPPPSSSTSPPTPVDTFPAVGGSLGLIRARDTGNSPTRTRVGTTTMASSYRELPVTSSVSPPQFSTTNPFTSALGLPRTAGGATRRQSRGGVASSLDTSLGGAGALAHGLFKDNTLLPPLYVPPIEAQDAAIAPTTFDVAREDDGNSAPAIVGASHKPQMTSATGSPTTVLSPTKMMPLQHRGATTIVFDLDETLCNNRRPGKALLRPHTMELLHHLHTLRNDASVNCYVELVLWTASMECVARPVVERIDPTGTLFQHRIYRDRRWYKETGYTKDLKRLGRELHHTVIIENSPASVHLNRKHSILVRDFVSGPDTDLIIVKEVLDGWIRQVGACARTLQGPPPNDVQSPSSIVKFLTEHPSITSGNEVVSRPALPTSRGAVGCGGGLKCTTPSNSLRSSSMGLSVSRFAINRPSLIAGGLRGRLY